MTRIEKNWGFEEIIHADENYTCKKLVYTKPIASSLHYHPNKHETFVVLDGKFVIEVLTNTIFLQDGHYVARDPAFPTETQTQDVGAGFSVVLCPRTAHRVRCVEPGTIIEASTFDDPNDCVRLIPSEA